MRSTVKNIGILTLPFHTNYGGILQGAALYHFLRHNGYNAIVLESRQGMGRINRGVNYVLERVPGQNFRDARRKHLRMMRHRGFLDQHIPRRTGPLRSSVEMTRATARHKLDAVIVGSDQIWRREYGRPETFADRFLEFVKGDAVRRISYAASFGHDAWAYPKQTDKIAGLLARFDAVSVREKSGVAICAEALGRPDVAHVLDPTLLVDPEHWQAVAGPREDRGKMVMKYVLDTTPETLATSQSVLSRFGPEFTVQSAAASGPHSLHDIPQWLRFFRDADFVLTDSFHGTAFAIIFRKNFAAVINAKRGADRFTSLLGMLGLSDRLLTSGEDGSRLVDAPIDYDAVDAKLQELRAQSSDFLMRALA